MNYSDDLCSSLDNATNDNKEVFFMGDLNLNWCDNKNSNKAKLLRFTEGYNMIQMVRNATRCSIRNGICTETCIDLIFTSVPQQCSSVCVFPVGWYDHNIVSITRISKISKRPHRIIVKSFKRFNCEEFKRESAACPWELIFLEDNFDHASECFTELLTEVMNQHAPICSASWIEVELYKVLEMRNEAKAQFLKSNLQFDQRIYRTLRNYAPKLICSKKASFYRKAFTECGHDSKKHGIQSEDCWE